MRTSCHPREQQQRLRALLLTATTILQGRRSRTERARLATAGGRMDVIDAGFLAERIVSLQP
jgi:hypothetical protein